MSEKKALKKIQAIIRKATKSAPPSVTLYLIRETTKQAKRTEHARQIAPLNLTSKGRKLCQS